MAGPDAIRVEGVVIATLPKSLFRVELPNGHRILAFVGVRLRAEADQILSGDKVVVEMTPFDMSQGRITTRN